MNQNIIYITSGIFVLIVGVLLWFFVLPKGADQPEQTGTGVQTGGTQSTTFAVGADTSASNQPFSTGASSATGVTIQSVFKIDDGPVAVAVLIQTTRPTSTIARYVMQQNAHVFDLVLDTPGAVARSASNTTVPGVAEAQWAVGGQTALLHYLDGDTIKTLALSLPPLSTSTVRTPARMRFLPDGILDSAFSPDGKSVAYLLKSSSGADGYTAAADGSNPKKLFSLPLSQLILSWPAPSTLLAYSKSAAGTPGVLFSINAKSGAVTPLLYANGLTATANRDFSKILYQQSGATVPISYSRDIKTGLNSPLSFDPYPEKCAWSSVATFALYCASPLQFVGSGFLDAWHSGTQTATDAVFGYNLQTEHSVILAVPGGPDGGVPSDILSLGVSPDDKYIVFIKKDDRSLWGVRL